MTFTFSFSKLRQPTGQRLSNVRNKLKFQLGQSYSYIMRKVWYHQIWIQNNLGFMYIYIYLSQTWISQVTAIRNVKFKLENKSSSSELDHFFSLKKTCFIKTQISSMYRYVGKNSFFSCLCSNHNFPSIFISNLAIDNCTNS